MTDDELAAIEDRCKVATPGPWHPLLFARQYEVVAEGVVVATVLSPPAPITPRCLRDTDFIAAARTDIPDLLAEVRRLWVELACSKAMYRDLQRDKSGPAALLAEVNRLRAEVSRLRAENEELLALPSRVTTTTP